MSDRIQLRSAARRGSSRATGYRIICEPGVDIVVSPSGRKKYHFAGRNRLKAAIEFAAAAIVGYEAGQRAGRKRSRRKQSRGNR